MSSKLTIDDLHEITTELLPARNEWQEIGTALGLKASDIQGINSTKPQRALSTVLTTALQRRSDLTWGKLIDVLKEPLVDQYALASKLAKKYGASTMPDSRTLPKNLSSKEDSIDGVPPPDEDTDSPQLYEMKNRQALIINIVKHPTKERHGSDKDKDALEETLKMLGYTVHVETDLKRDEIIPKVLEHAEKDKHCDSFICCILAHGNQGVVFGSDGKEVEIKKISKELNTIKQLRGNPKIFFFQACQGSDAPKGIAATDNVSSVSGAKPIEIDVAIPKLPRDSDFFYGCASSFETVSMRDHNEGSLYIQALCRVLKRKYKKEDLITMVTRVHYQVAGDERQLPTGESYQQQPQLVSTLRKLVKF